MARQMSDTEIRHRKKLQGTISRTTSTLGLTGLGLTGAAALAAKKPGLLRNVPKLNKVTPHQIKNAAINTGLVSGGIGGLGGFNFAAYTNAEAKRKKQIMKSDDEPLEMGYYGEEGRPIELPPIVVPESEINKAWSPVAEPFDSEARRSKRSKRYEKGAAAAAGASGGYAGFHTVKAIKAAKKDRPGLKRIPGIDVHAPVMRHGGRAAAGLAGVGVAAGVAEGIRRKREGSWQSYSKANTTSAFGVDHDESRIVDH